MSKDLYATGNDTGPTAAYLAAIEAEWPQIEAALAELDAEIEALGVRPDPDYWRTYRRTEARAIRAAVIAFPHPAVLEDVA
jgi:hypothetical protein